MIARLLALFGYRRSNGQVRRWFYLWDFRSGRHRLLPGPWRDTLSMPPGRGIIEARWNP